MAFEWYGYPCEGAWSDPTNLQPQPGVYLIFSKAGDNWKLLDVGEAGNVSERVANHDRRDCWTRNNVGIIYYAAHYTSVPEEQRRKIEALFRMKDNPPCGIR